MSVDWDKLRRDAEEIDEGLAPRSLLPAPEPVLYERRRVPRDESQDFGLASALGARSRAEQASQANSQQNSDQLFNEAFYSSFLNTARIWTTGEGPSDRGAHSKENWIIGAQADQVVSAPNSQTTLGQEGKPEFSPPDQFPTGSDFAIQLTLARRRW